ncbi:uncharacterized protein LOC143893678 [Temnothorax americanus]|uniref:uncharacterized protein LOC143893678 n=1 Tax=Temnothorax americanus TaxID=1964332 RepID=UPI0040687CAD
MLETWIGEKGWERIRGRLPKGYEWGVQMAKKKNKKGRAIGGMIMGIRKGLKEKGTTIEVDREGWIAGKVRTGGENWSIIGVYAKKEGMEEKIQELGDRMEKKEEGRYMIIGGDFNARTGQEGGRIEEEEGGGLGEGRRSKDKKVDREGRLLVNSLEERGWEILNGNVRGDEEGEFTFTGGRGSTVIDYIIGEGEVREKIVSMVVGERVDSDHHPLEVVVRRGEEEEGRRGGWKKRSRGVWNEEGTKRFIEKIGEVEVKEVELNKEWEEMEIRITEAIKGVEEELGNKKGKVGWWDEECREAKKETRRKLRDWRKKRGEASAYKESRKEFKEICKRKKEEENQRWERKVEGARREAEVWEIVNRERRKRRGIEEGIEEEEWKEHFMKLLGGVEGRVRMGKEGEREEKEGEEEEEISLEEMRRVIKKLKDGKAMGKDEIPGEAWKRGGKGLEVWTWKFINKIWKGGGWPEIWKEGIIAPIVKKGEGKRAEEYRGVTIMPSLYKVYTAILAERIREEIEGKRMVPHNQTGFRRGMGTIDNIYVLNYMVNRRLEKKGGKLIACFVDLKAAFDSVDRGILIKAMRERGIREGLVRRTEEMLRETKSRVRGGNELGEVFWTGRGVRQGCPLSPILFNVLLADLEEEMDRVKWGGIMLGGKRVYTLAYADDIVLIAEDEDQMRSMIERLEGYLGRKRLELNVGKTKIMRFRKGGGRDSKRKWRWEGKELEEVREFRYLGYVFQRNGGQEAQIRERIKKAAAVMGKVWGIGKRRFGKDWGKRLWLFDRLVWTVLSYGAEIWGWREREGIERMEERYIRWVLGADVRTPWYLVREKLQREKLRGRAGMRAWRFEKKLEEGGGSELARSAWEELKEREREGKAGSDWERERGKFFEDRGVGLKEVEKIRGDGEEWFLKLFEGDRETQRKERWERIEKSEYNKWYKWIKGEGIPGYLKKGWGESRWGRVARFRLGNEIGESRYWEAEEKKKCRLCGNKEETWEHVWEECRRWNSGKGSWQEAVGWVLDEEGGGEEWMLELEGERMSGKGDLEELKEGSGEDGRGDGGEG